MLAALVLVMPGAAAPAAAQSSLPDPLVRAEQLMRSGRMFAAESVYYWAATVKPRDPQARLALGGYLASRGALRTAATLLEEARFFGGDARAVAIQLVPLYERMGEYAALSALPSSPLSAAEQRRAEWLRQNRPTRRGPDSVMVRLRRTSPEPVGAIVLRIGRDTVVAHIDPRARGLTLNAAWAGRRELMMFTRRGEASSDAPVGVVRELRIGELVLGNVPVSFATTGDAGRAVLGLDDLARFAPTFDEQGGTLTLRVNGRAPARRAGRAYPTLARDGSLLLLEGRTLHPLETTGRTLLDGRRWTMRPGEIVVQ